MCATASLKRRFARRHDPWVHARSVLRIARSGWVLRLPFPRRLVSFDREPRTPLRLKYGNTNLR
jgi:hypothetical protein